MPRLHLDKPIRHSDAVPARRVGTGARRSLGRWDRSFSRAAYLLTAEARRTRAWFERPVDFAERRTPTVLAAEWRLPVLRAAARGATDAICFFGRCWFLFLASARDLSVSLRCASALAFLQMSLMEGVSATGTAASSFALDRPS